MDPPPDIRGMVAPYGGDYLKALHTSAQKDRLAKRMEDEAGSAVILMILLLVLSQTLLVASIVGGAWWLASGRRKV